LEYSYLYLPLNSSLKIWGYTVLIGIVGNTWHAVRSFLSLKSMVTKFRRKRFKQNGSYRTCSWRCYGCCL